LRVGLRVGSAISLQVEDVDLDGALLRLRRMKGNAEDTAYLPAETVELLRGHLAGRSAGPLFCGSHGRAMGTRQVHRRLAAWGRRAALTRAVWPHALRHSFAMQVYQTSGDLLVTARALGHRSVTSTAVYARPSEASVRSALNVRHAPTGRQQSDSATSPVR
jgi:integrase/recombinase XerC